MPVVTLQLGQCGNQLGKCLLQNLASELHSGATWQHGAEEFFRLPDVPSEGRAPKAIARSVLIDLEPKVIEASRQFAAREGHHWKYGDRSWICQQGGAGNNWALGYHRYGPQVKAEALELVRREVEHCDSLQGFLVLQSMAGGTGAGFGTLMVEALRDEYPQSFRVSTCVWPYATGEVVVQPYNTLLTLSHLAAHSDGIILLQNEALHRTCKNLLRLQSPTLDDLNTVAASSLAAALLPARKRHASPQVHDVGAAANALAAGPFGKFRPLPDVVEHLCCHPAFRIMSLRHVPQLPATSIDFTTFTWPAITKRLRQMLLTGSHVEDSIDWSTGLPAAGRAPLPHGSGTHLRVHNRSVASLLLLRGQSAVQVDVAEFENPQLYAPWSFAPLSVAASSSTFNRCLMSGALLASDQSAVSPVRGMQDKAYEMLAAGAYLHQYQQHGLEAAEFHECFAHVEELLGHYAVL